MPALCQNPSEYELKHMMIGIDSYQNSKITFNELLAVMARRMTGTDQKKKNKKSN